MYRSRWFTYWYSIVARSDLLSLYVSSAEPPENSNEKVFATVFGRPSPGRKFWPEIKWNEDYIGDQRYKVPFQIIVFCSAETTTILSALFSVLFNFLNDPCLWYSRNGYLVPQLLYLWCNQISYWLFGYRWLLVSMFLFSIMVNKRMRLHNILEFW